MPIHAIIRRQRLLQGLTQEQVAQRLGVTAPAVNKWERGATCPDIALLAPLARLLKTDVNTLLCFQEDLTTAEIVRYTNEVADALREKGYAAGICRARELLQEYPSCGLLLHNLALLLEGGLLMSGLPPEEKRPYEEEIRALYQRLLEGDDPELAHGAAYLLASRHIAQEEYDAAQELLDRIPERTGIDKRQLQASLLQRRDKPTEAAVLLEQKCLGLANELQMTLFALVSCAQQAGEEAAAGEIAEICAGVVELLGLWAYGKSVGPLELATRRRDPKETLAALEAAFSAMLRPWDMSASVLYRHLAPKPQPGQAPGARMLPALLTELETDPKYDFLRQEPDFWSLLEQYRRKCAQEMGENPTALNTAPASPEER